VRTFVLVWSLGALVGLLANVRYSWAQLRPWWLERPPMHQKALVSLFFLGLSLAFWPILLILIVGAGALAPKERNRG